MENKPVAIVIYGMVAVGKLTVAKVLQKEFGYKLTHNHLINDLVWSIFDRGTLEGNSLIERLRYELYEEAVKQGVSVIITHCYSHDYVSPTGLSDPDYLKTLEERLEAAGAMTLFVHLQADNPVLLERVQGESRHEYRKLTDVSKMKEYLDDKSVDVRTSASVKNNLVIDTTNMEVEEVVRTISEYLQKL
ncbi:MAG TPA: AAA family ATPase [Candidatus Paceibacterota bacterium]|jgi:deoxyadenosine/deoxycytidine kinase|nr:AAA family ATPase [Candidatus Paceibacterota bacterium]